MKILVTGASGFVGNFLLAALRGAGHAWGNIFLPAVQLWRDKVKRIF